MTFENWYHYLAKKESLKMTKLLEMAIAKGDRFDGNYRFISNLTKGDRKLL
ncbi:MAG: hypothetical protein QNJ72_30640 [Pleurocapsa sp. MO_226.B13]|nr:hypothetical protein [Pleurocapsa sp. MO_226.B13]